MNQKIRKELIVIANTLVTGGKGILAADQSPPSAGKLLARAGVKTNDSKNRLTYRNIIFSTSGIEEFISGVILHDETMTQKALDGRTIPKYLDNKGIIPGIKVDRGKSELANFPGEYVTEGLDGLTKRLEGYKKLGAKFAKWRAVFVVSESTPTRVAIGANNHALARYAAICQSVGIVPIVEPEVLMDGDHPIKKSAEVGKRVLTDLFSQLFDHKVILEGLLLKPSMIHPGKDYKEAKDEVVAKATLKVLRESVPAGIPGVVFLSGGETPGEATSHLNAINKLGSAPWELTFSFGRALQEPCLEAWAGKKENVVEAQRVFYERAKLDALAREGKFK